MTRQDFERLAKAVRAMRQTHCFNDMLEHLGPTSYANVLETVIDQIALACGDLGERFDYDRFDKACRDSYEKSV